MDAAGLGGRGKRWQMPKYAILEAPSALGHVPEHLGLNVRRMCCSERDWPMAWPRAAPGGYRRRATARSVIRGRRS
jgi:hypothetical protein